MLKRENKKIYLDYASTTPVDPAVLQAMLPYFGTPLVPRTYHLEPNLFGNPGSLHSFGQKASAAVFKSRQAIAAAIGAHYSEIIFTGSATEANNLALRGVVKQITNYQLPIIKTKPRIIISAFEHESILKTCEDLEKEGVEVYRIPVSKDGFIKIENLKSVLNENTILVSIMYANNEIGTIQPIREISEIIQQFREQIANSKLQMTRQNKSHSLSAIRYPLIHTDAVQAFQYLNCNVDDLSVDLMTLSAHKIYGPKGIGVLYVRKQIANSKAQIAGGTRPFAISSLPTIVPIVAGGGQEDGLRSGTENVPAIVGFAKATNLATKIREKEAKRVEKLRNDLLSGLKKIFPQLQVNGSLKNRLPNNLNFYLPAGRQGLPKISGEQALVNLDLLGIAVSSGSACSARSLEPVKTLLAMGFGTERSQNSLRLTLGRPTSAAEIKKVLEAFKKLKK